MAGISFAMPARLLALALASTFVACGASGPRDSVAEIVRNIELRASADRKLDVPGDFPLTYFFAGGSLDKCILWIPGEGHTDETLEWYFDGGRAIFVVQGIKLYRLHKNRFGPDIDTQWINEYTLGDGGVSGFATTAPPNTDLRKLTWAEISDDVLFINQNRPLAIKN